MDTLLSIPLEAHSHQSDLSPSLDPTIESTIDSIASSIDPQPIIPVEPIVIPTIPHPTQLITPPHEEEERSDAGPYCICRGADDGTPMICCDTCNEWYHCRCIRMGVKIAKTLNEFYCFKCKPEAAYNSPMVHLEDYTVIDKKSPSPYATRSGGRRTQLIPFGSELFQPDSSDEESASSSSDEEISRKRTKPKPVARTSSTSNVRVRENKEKRKLARQEDPVAKKAKMSSDNDPKRLQIRKLIAEPLCQEKDFDEKTISEIAADIERELYKLYDFNTYKAKIRTLLFNFKDPKNTELRKSVLTKELPADSLAKMNSTDLANKDLAQYRRKRDEKHTAELVIKDEPKPAVMLLRGDRWASEGFDALTSSVVSTTLKPEELEPSASVVIEEKSESKSESTTVEEEQRNEPEQPPVEEEEEVQLEINTEILNSAPIEIPTFNDFDDTPPEEPVKEAAVKEVPGQVWAGYIKTTQLFRVRAIKVGSATIKQKHFPETLVQCGRMEMGQLFNYLPQLEFSTSRKLDIVVFEAIAEDDEEDYVAAFDSLRSSNRAAVVKTSYFKESFIFPLPANSAVPDWAQGYVSDKDRLLGAFISARSSSDRKKQRDIRRKQTEKNVEEEYNPMYPSTAPSVPVAPPQNPILASLGVPQVPLTMLGNNPLLGNFMMPNMGQPPMTAPPMNAPMMGQPPMNTPPMGMMGQPPMMNSPPMLVPKANPMMAPPMNAPMMGQPPMTAPPMGNPMMGMTPPMLDMGLLQQLSSMLGTTQPIPAPNNAVPTNMNTSRPLADPRRMRNM